MLLELKGKADIRPVEGAPKAAEVGDLLYPDEVLALTDLSHESAPPIPKSIVDVLRMTVLQARGADVGAETRKLRRFWAREGAVAIHSASVEMVQAGRTGDAAGAVDGRSGETAFGCAGRDRGRRPSR